MITIPGNCLPRGTYNCTQFRGNVKALTTNSLVQGVLEWGVVVNGNANISNSQIYEGGIAVGGSLSESNSQLLGSNDCLLAKSAMPLRVNDFKQGLIDISTELSLLNSTGSVSVNNGKQTRSFSK